MSKDTLKCEGLVKSFAHPSGNIEVLKGIDFEVPAGKMTAVLGRSGTGKSTFLQVLGTLDAPSQGTVSFGDKNLFALDDKALSSFRNVNLGFVFQFHYLLPEFDALENVMMPAWIGGSMDALAAKKRAEELMEVVQLSHRLHHKPTELSGGEQQRVSLARALMCSPSLILTDELTGNLDSKTGKEVLTYLQKMNKTYGVTILSVTHQKEMAEVYYEEMYTMRDGLLQKEN